MKLLGMAVLQLVLIGCAEPKPCEPITITKKCETKMPADPKWSQHDGSDASWLKAELENSAKKDGLIYDLKAALEKCL